MQDFVDEDFAGEKQGRHLLEAEAEENPTLALTDKQTISNVKIHLMTP